MRTGGDWPNMPISGVNTAYDCAQRCITTRGLLPGPGYLPMHACWQEVLG